jgi:hypothetical protein
MVFQPVINQQLVIRPAEGAAGEPYRIAEHPSAPGIPYGQEGRTAIVYQLVKAAPDSSRPGEAMEKQAFKVFKARYRVPGLVSLSRRLAPFATLPGLRVCRRTVLSPQYDDDLLSEHPDLLYSVVMPWIEGPSWTEVLLNSQLLSPEQSLAIARAFAGLLAEMEQESLAHCDLSGPNVLLPILADNEAPSPDRRSTPVELVDVEQMYGPDLRKPEFLTSGSSGYAHRTAHEGMWSAEADRFAGALILAEMLGWCDRRAHDLSWGESYFDPDEMHQETERYHMLADILRERWGDRVAGLFERAWRSGTPLECPTFGEWMVALPRYAPAPAPTQKPEEPPLPIPEPSPLAAGEPQPDPLTLIQQAGQLEDTGDLAQALELYLQARSIVPPDGGLTQELDLMIGRLQSRLTPPASPSPPPPTTAPPSPPPTDDRQPAAASALPLPSHTITTAATTTGSPRNEPLALSEANGEAAPVAPGRQSAPRSPLKILLPGLLALALLVIAVVVWFLAQSSAQEQAAANGATATVMAETAATSTAEAVAADATAAAEVATMQAQQTATEVARIAAQTSTAQAIEAEGTAQAFAAATTQAQVIATRQAEIVQTVTVLRESYRAIPRSEKAIAVDNRQSITTLRTLEGHTAQVNALAFSPDGSMLASVSSDKTLRIWRMPDGAPIHTITGKNDLHDIAFSPDGRTIAVASDSGVDLWDAVDGLLLRSIEGDNSFAVAFSPDALTVASGSYGGSLYLARVLDGALLLTLRGHTSYITNVIFSPDGAMIASASEDNTVRLWRATDGASLKTLSGHTGRVVGLAFVPDGQAIISGAGDDTIREWRISDGAPLRTFSDIRVTGIAFSPDGQILATGGSWENNIRLWRSVDAAQLATLEGHTSSVYDVAFSPDGALLASSSEDNTIRLWGVP